MEQTTNMQPSGGKSKPIVLETCPICGEAKKIQLPPVMGNMITNTLCECDKKRQAEEDEARRKFEAKEERRRNIRDSLMDERAKRTTFDTLRVTPENERYIRAAKNYCKDWKENYENNRGLLFYGGPGRGKTTLAYCIVNKLIADGVAAKGTGINSLIQLVHSTFDNDRESSMADVKAVLEAAPLLVLDDLGAEYKTEWSTTFLYEVIDARYRNEKPTIITTNLTLEQLREHSTGADGVLRSYDRLIETLTPVEFNGENYRVEKAKENKRDYDFFRD